MKTIFTFAFVATLFSMIFTGCTGSNDYNTGYNSHNNVESKNDREIDRAISSEMNSLSDKDIAQLNKLK
jgi:hypothetical protein